MAGNLPEVTKVFVACIDGRPLEAVLEQFRNAGSTHLLTAAGGPRAFFDTVTREHLQAQLKMLNGIDDHGNPQDRIGEIVVSGHLTCLKYSEVGSAERRQMIEDYRVAMESISTSFPAANIKLLVFFQKDGDGEWVSEEVIS
jgi:hypothetical protein